jgi:hypothetical protein
MLTRRDVLNQLKIMGVGELSQLKKGCRDFEQYMAVYYDVEILKSEEVKDQPPAAGRKRDRKKRS